MLPKPQIDAVPRVLEPRSQQSGHARISELEQELRELTYSISHDMLEPLRAVTGYADLLQASMGNTTSEKQQKYIKSIDEGAQRMQNMLEAMLNYSRAGRTQFNIENIDANHSWSFAQMELQTKAKEVDAQITSTDLPQFLSSRAHLTEIYIQLMSNALKFSRSPCQIHATAQNLESAWQFSVRDNGIGIDEPDSGRPFALFQKLNAPQEYPGVGAGLTIAKCLVERLGGRIWVESPEMFGATFHFTIPHHQGSQ